MSFKSWAKKNKGIRFESNDSLFNYSPVDKFDFGNPTDHPVDHDRTLMEIIRTAMEKYPDAVNSFFATLAGKDEVLRDKISKLDMTKAAGRRPKVNNPGDETLARSMADRGLGQLGNGY